MTGLGEYGDFVAQVDATVGEVLAALDRVGASDDTLVIFTSDNGSYMGVGNHRVDHTGMPRRLYYDIGRHRPNSSWRGVKRDIWEGGHRVPFLARWPGVVEAGSEAVATVTFTDLYATLAEIVGEPLEIGVAKDSVSLLPMLQGEPVSRGVPVIHHSWGGMFAIRDGHWKLVFGNGSGGQTQPKGTPFEQPWHLYDLSQDPAETTNVVDDHPEVVERLDIAFERIRSSELQPQEQEPTLSDDATLSTLALGGGDFGVLTSDVTVYTADVGNAVAVVVIADANGSTTGGQRTVSLAEGANAITVTVMAEDETITQTYTVTVARAAALTASVENLPAAHDGATAFTFELRFSEEIRISFRTLRDDAFTVTGSTVTGARRLEKGSNLRWEIMVLPDSDADVSITLPAGRTCNQTGAVCTADGKPLSNHVEATIPGPANESPVAAWSATLTAGADTSVVPMTSGYSLWGALGALSTNTFTIDDAAYRVLFIAHHADGVHLGMTGEIPTDFVLRIDEAAFAARESSVPSSKAAAAYWWADQTFTWTPGETVQVSITPVHDQDEALPERQVGPPTAYFSSVPESHNGVGALTFQTFTFRTYFSEDIPISDTTLRDHAFVVSGGTVIAAKRVNGSNRIWEITVTPHSTGDVTIALPAARVCDVAGVICAADGRQLYNSPELTVPGPSE